MRNLLRVADRLHATVPRGAGVTVLAYHRIGEGLGSNVEVSPAAFAAQLDLLAERFEVLSLDEAVERHLGAAEPVRKDRPTVVITFDDGTPDWDDVVAPLLVARAMSATFYVATGFVEDGRRWPGSLAPISWAGLASLSSTGVATIASHTHNHRLLHRAGRAEATEELTRSQELIGERLGLPCRHFAYPKAMLGSGEAQQAVRALFVTAAVAGNRVNLAGRADLHRLGRTPVTRSDDIATFARKANGGFRLEGLLRSVRDRRRHRHAVV